MERLVKVLQEELKYWQDFAYKEAQQIAELKADVAEKDEQIAALKEIIANKKPF